MALIFPRLARNFIKAGYYPTDERTLGGIIAALDIDGRQLRILDPLRQAALDVQSRSELI